MTNKSVPRIKLLYAILLLAACTSIGLSLTAYSHAQRASASAAPGTKSTVARTTVTNNSLHDLSLRLDAIKGEATSSAPVAECEQLHNHCGTSPEPENADPDNDAETDAEADIAPDPAILESGAAIEQKKQGPRDAVPLLESFDGLGEGFNGPQGTAAGRNPSDNSLAIGPDHIVQIVNSRMAVFTKKGSRYDTSGKVLYGPVITNSIFAGFGGQCEQRTSGDAVVRYDQLANRWLYVLPIFRRPPNDPQGPYSMCYAVSQGPDPLGPYYRSSSNVLSSLTIRAPPSGPTDTTFPPALEIT